MAKASDNVFPKVIVSEGTVPASPAAGQQKLYIDSADHKVKRVNSSGAVTTVEGGFSPKVANLRYTTGNLKVASTTFVAFTDGAGASIGTALDLTLTSSQVTVGDTIEVGFGGTWNNDAVDGFVTFGTLVSSSIVNTIYGEKGLPGAFGPSGSYANAYATGFYVVQSGDLSSGALTVRPLGRGSSTTAKILLAGGTSPNKDAVLFWVKNWGA